MGDTPADTGKIVRSSVDVLSCHKSFQFAQNRMRVLVIGSPKVGKTSLIRRMADNVFVEKPEKPDKFEHSRLTAMARAIEGQLYKIEFQETGLSPCAYELI